MQGDPPQNQTGNATLSAASSNGSRIVSVHLEKKMKVFPVFETDLDGISYFNTASTIFFSIGSSLLSISTRNGIEAKVFGDAVTWVGFLLFALGGFSWYKKKTILDKVKSDVTEI